PFGYARQPNVACDGGLPITIGFGNGPWVTLSASVTETYTVAPLMNVFAGIVRITRVTRSASVTRSGLHSTARLSSNTGEGHVAFDGGEIAAPATEIRRTNARRTNRGRILHPHRDLLSRPELQAVPKDVRKSEPREPGEQVPRIGEVHDGQTRGRWWRGRHRRRGGSRREAQGDRRRGRGGGKEGDRADERVPVQHGRERVARPGLLERMVREAFHRPVPDREVRGEDPVRGPIPVRIVREVEEDVHALRDGRAHHNPVDLRVHGDVVRPEVLGRCVPDG